jgi:hypothetical protein
MVVFNRFDIFPSLAVLGDLRSGVLSVSGGLELGKSSLSSVEDSDCVRLDMLKVMKGNVSTQ